MSTVTRTCGDCALYAPYRSPESKRICPTQKGVCTWSPPVIVWPLSCMEDYGGRYPRLPRPTRVWPEYRATDCACFVPREVKTATTQKQLEI